MSSIKEQIEAEAEAFCERKYPASDFKNFYNYLGVHREHADSFTAGAAFRDRWWAERWMRQVDHYVMNTVHSEEKMKLSQEMTAAARGVLG